MRFTVKKLRLLILALDGFLLLLAWKLDAILNLMLNSPEGCVFLQNGLICPACGGTRSAFHFVSGNFCQSFAYHPAVFCIILYLIALVILWNLDYVFTLGFAKKIHRKMTDYRVIIAIAVSFVVIGIGRNFWGDQTLLYEGIPA